MHRLEYLEFSTRKSEKTIIKECARLADREGDYKGQIRSIRFTDKILKGYENARAWIENNDAGWYDNLAIKYIENGKKHWLVKIEFHC